MKHISRNHTLVRRQYLAALFISSLFISLVSSADIRAAETAEIDDNVDAESIEANDAVDSEFAETDNTADFESNATTDDESDSLSDGETLVESVNQFRDAIGRGGSIVLGKNITYDYSVHINKETSLDLNGYTLTVNGVFEAEDSLTITGDGILDGTITIKDGDVSIVSGQFKHFNVLSGGTLYIKGGTINGYGRGNDDGDSEAGCIEATGGKIVMSGGTICKSNPSYLDVGVYLESGGEFKMTGGEIYGHHIGINTISEEDEDLNNYETGNCVIEIRGGKIHDNSSYGIFCGEDSYTNIYGGEIYDNGTGVMAGHFYMFNGDIHDNKSTGLIGNDLLIGGGEIYNNATGVLVEKTAILRIMGGSIHTHTYHCIQCAGTLELGGDPVIGDSNEGSAIYSSNSTLTIRIVDTLLPGCKVAISSGFAYYRDFTSGYYANNKDDDPAQFFYFPSGGFTISLNPETLEATTKMIDSNANSEGSNTTNESTSSSSSSTTTTKKSSTLTLLYNISQTYNGKKVSYPAKYIKKSGSTGNVTIRYYTDKACKNKIPINNVKNAGTYYVRATVAADAKYKSATSNVAKIEITKKKQTLSGIPKKLIGKKKYYNQQTFQLAGKAKGTLSYKLTFKNYDGIKITSNGKIIVPKRKKKGVYTLNLTIKAKATTNYKAATFYKTIKIQLK